MSIPFTQYMAEKVGPKWRLTKTQRFVLKCLDSPGHVPEPTRRYTLSLRIMEERGLVSRSIAHDRWSITEKGRNLLA